MASDPLSNVVIFDFRKSLEQLHLEKAPIQSRNQMYYYYPKPKVSYFIKSCADPKGEAEKMILAGPNCVIQPIGIAGHSRDSFAKNPYWGIIMPLAQPIKEDDWTVDRIKAAKNAVDLLHTQGFVHCDIHPSNFLLWEKRVVLCDLGCAQTQKAGIANEPPWDSSWNFFSPERILSVDTDFRKASVDDDKYAMGLSIYCIVTKKIPYGVEHDKVEEAVKKGTRVNFTEVKNVELRALIAGLCKVSL